MQVQSDTWEATATMVDLGPEAVVLLGEDGSVEIMTSDGAAVALFGDETAVLAEVLTR